MKKIVLSFITFIGSFSLSHGFEANIKVGYDFFRYSNIKEYDSSKNETKKIDANYERGFVLGVEILPFTFKDERIKLGVGLECNFGEKQLKYHRKNASLTDQLRFYNLTMMPLYATAKFTYYRPKNIDLNLYTFARLGYAFANEITLRNVPNNRPLIFYNNVSGIYYGLGFGIDYKYFLAEILYDGRYNDAYVVKNVCGTHPNPFCKFEEGYEHTKSIHHKVGVRLGVQLGSQHFKKPQIKSNTKGEINVK